jgi:hypothetical protein
MPDTSPDAVMVISSPAVNEIPLSVHAVAPGTVTVAGSVVAEAGAAWSTRSAPTPTTPRRQPARRDKLKKTLRNGFDAPIRAKADRKHL